MRATAGVRKLGVDDIEAYCAIRAEMLVDTPASFGASPEDDRCTDPAFVRTIVTHPVKRTHVAEIYGVFTRPAARRQGHGKRVMDALLKHAVGIEGVEVIGLSVSSEAPAAQAMYEALGFEIWGREPRALRIEDRRPTEIHMWRPVS